MSGDLTIYPPHANATQRVHLQDHGQDFLWLDIDADGVIVGAGPFQGWLWSGEPTNPHGIKRGKPVPILLHGSWTTIRYPVTRVQALKPKRRAA